MENQANKEGLLMAYRVPGFRARAHVEPYDGAHSAFVITLDRRQKKRCAACAARCITAFTTEDGFERAIWTVAAVPSISISSIAAWRAESAAA